MRSRILLRRTILTRIMTLLLFTVAAAASAENSDIVEGNPFATVKVTIYGDLQCGYCQDLRTMLDEKLLPKYGQQVAFIHRDLPLGRHDWARPAAMVARWVYQQNSQLGITFQRELLAEQEHMTPARLKSWIVQFAIRNKLSEQGITAALADPTLSTQVDQDIQMATARGVTKIPAVYVAGKSFAETIIYDDLARVLDQAVSR
jgi:protein-disulfide isomerase